MIQDYEKYSPLLRSEMMITALHKPAITASSIVFIPAQFERWQLDNAGWAVPGIRKTSSLRLP